jgi:hypothetical protein
LQQREVVGGELRKRDGRRGREVLGCFRDTVFFGHLEAVIVIVVVVAVISGLYTIFPNGGKAHASRSRRDRRGDMTSYPRLRTRTRAGCSRWDWLCGRLAVLHLAGASPLLKRHPLRWGVDDRRTRRTASGAVLVTPMQAATVVTAPGCRATAVVAAGNLYCGWTS